MNKNLETQKKKIFLCWSGKYGEVLARHLKEEMLKVEPFKGWVSSVDISPGAVSFDETQKALQNASFGILLLTPGALNSRWINFEAGFIFGQLGNCIILQFNGKILSPLDKLQVYDGTNEDGWLSVFKHMNSDKNDDEHKAWINFKFPLLKTLLYELNGPPYSYLNEIGKNTTNIVNSINQLKKNENALGNICFQHVILESFQELESQVKNIKTQFSLPSSKYPYYLLSLQQNINLKCKVRAVALVNIEEEYWQQPIGDKIRLSSQKENIRVFVFDTPKDFNIMYSTVREHARDYQVFAISRKKFKFIVTSYFDKDFSIIESNNESKILAVYDDTNLLNIPKSIKQKNVSFIIDDEEIERHNSQFNKLIDSKHIVPINGNESDDLEQLNNQLFKNLSLYTKVNAEMSEYINISEYDEHEIEHAYYEEMMNKMLEIFSQHRQSKDELVEVLEFGAGTGIFTQRLFEKQNLLKLSAVEIDWHCYRVLAAKFKKQEYRVNVSDDDMTILTKNNDERRIELYCKNSIEFDPPGKFDYIFSSFADHHIKVDDKTEYFNNVKLNFKNNDAVYIVGDEFLPEYDISSNNARRQALEAYHNHIIKIAKEKSQYVLAELEEAALRSGLAEKGDFKLSCSQYEKLLVKAGFRYEKVKIGPKEKELNNVGGVYVYTIIRKI